MTRDGIDRSVGSSPHCRLHTMCDSCRGFSRITLSSAARWIPNCATDNVQAVNALDGQQSSTPHSRNRIWSAVGGTLSPRRRGSAELSLVTTTIWTRGSRASSALHPIVSSELQLARLLHHAASLFAQFSFFHDLVGRRRQNIVSATMPREQPHDWLHRGRCDGWAMLFASV